MMRAVRFALVLVGGLGVLALVGYLALVRTTRSWFEHDLELSSKLAVSAARLGLGASWHQDPARVKQILTDITRDERILGSIACDPDGSTVAVTDDFPGEFGCEKVVPRWLAEKDAQGLWSLSTELPSGRVDVAAVPVDQPDAGVVFVVHDLGFWSRREQTARRASVLAFFVLALTAAVVTILAARLSRRGWALELQRALSGNPNREFQPLVRDVRSLMESLKPERQHDLGFGPWSPQRLKATLTQHLQGERVIILANREPYVHQRQGGAIKVLHPASGLVTALEPVMRACSGVWVAHGSGDADRETADARGHIKVPPESMRGPDGSEPGDQGGSYQLRRVWLTEQEEQGYYYGFSNEGLWPLCHVAHARPTFRAEDFEEYEKVNRRFAEAVLEEVEGDDPIVLVQDYHFALAPKMIREKLPKATIITFWHVPWPNAERFGICPFREEILAGLLGSSIVGFHTQQHCNNFLESVDSFLECRIDRERDAAVLSGRSTVVRPYPISIEWPPRWMAGLPDVAACREQVRAELGLPKDALLGVGVDRLDYTKGVEERVLAVDQMLSRHPSLRGKFTFAQLAAPSRTKISRYRELGERVEELVKEVNARWQQPGGCPPIVLLKRHHEPPTVFKYYRAADLCYVSSLHDGMNLVAKEFIAARDDEEGVLVLSQFTGAARDLTEAVLVNPYDLRRTGDALAASLSMPKEEQRERVRSMRRGLAEYNVYRWAGRMLIDAAEMRRRERMRGRLSMWAAQAGRV